MWVGVARLGAAGDDWSTTGIEATPEAAPQM
jgi:hypothetical protein